MTSRFNHAFTFAFEVISNNPFGEDVTAEMLRTACIERLNRIEDCEILECCGAPFDTYDMDED